MRQLEFVRVPEIMELYREKEFWIAAETTVLLEPLAKKCFTHLWGKTPSRGGKKHWKAVGE